MQPRMMITNSPDPDSLDIFQISVSSVVFTPNLVTLLYFLSLPPKLPINLLTILAASDTFVSGTFIVTFILRKTAMNIYLSFPMMTSGIFLSWAVTTYISVGRCVAIIQPFYRVKKSHIVCLTVGTVLIIIFSIACDTYFSYTSTFSVYFLAYVVWIGFLVLLSVTVTIICTVLTTFYLFKESVSGTDERIQTKRRRATVIVISLSIAFCLVMLSCTILTLTGKGGEDSLRYQMILLLLNSVLNPLIHIFINQELRDKCYSVARQLLSLVN